MTRQEERQLRIARSHQRKEDQRIKKEKERLYISILCGICILLMIVITLTTSKGSDDYYHSQSGLFTVCILMILTSFLAFKPDNDFLEVLKKLRASGNSFTRIEKSHLFWMINFLLSLLGLLLVDLSFLAHGGLRIGAVAAIALVKVLTVLFKR